MLVTWGHEDPADELLAALGRAKEAHIIGAVTSNGAGHSLQDVPSCEPNQVPKMLETETPEVMVDWSEPSTTAEYVTAAAEHDVPVVTGTTPLEEPYLGTIEEAATEIPMLHIQDLSAGKAAFSRAAEVIAKTIPNFDVELTDTRHSGYLQSPSASAEAVLDRMEALRGNTLAVHGRLGTHPREEDRGNREVGVHSRRVGDGYGDLEMIFGGSGQHVSLSYSLENPDSFVDALLENAMWLTHQEPGLHDVSDLP